MDVGVALKIRVLQSLIPNPVIPFRLNNSQELDRKPIRPTDNETKESVNGLNFFCLINMFSNQ